MGRPTDDIDAAPSRAGWTSRVAGAHPTSVVEDDAGAGGADEACVQAGQRFSFFADRVSGEEFSLLAGHIDFAVEDELGHGGQARVYLVRDDRGRRYAFKTYRSAASARIEWDALKLHENDLTVPRPYVCGMVAGGMGEARALAGRHGMVMEYVEGETLEHLLARRADDLPTCEEALAYIAPIVRFGANACNSRAAHAHRDIKPANIVIDRQGRARLLDFGIAPVGSKGVQSRGTPGYAAPELMEGGAVGQGGAVKLDSYSIAATLFALTRQGEPPVYGSGADLRVPLRHDGALREGLSRDIADELQESFGIVPDESLVAAGLDSAYAAMDERINAVLARALAIKPQDRVAPDELEALLPLRPSEYRYRLFGDALLSCVRLRSGAAEVALPAVGAEADRAFVEALDYFNFGQYERAIPILQAQSDKGNASAMYYLGLCIRDGLGGLPFDSQRVAVLFSQAAKQGNILAQNAFGHMLIDGDGVEANRAKGIEWIREAARDDADAGRTGFPVAKAWLEASGL